jgi:ferritin-like metal-binding protein YciE
MAIFGLRADHERVEIGNQFQERFMKKNSLRHLYLEELKDLYNAENQLVKALPKMAKAATSEELRAGFEEHLEQTKGHVSRLEEIFEAMEESPKGKKCKGMEGLITEGSEMIGEDPGDEELDAGLISAAQRVEHYEIAGYGSVRTYARLLGDEDAASLLEETLKEEKETDQKLSSLAEQINLQAGESENEDEGEDEEVSPSQVRSSNGARRGKPTRANSRISR